MSAAAPLWMLLGTCVLFVAGVRTWYGGWAQRAEAASRSRIATGEAPGQRLKAAVDARLRRSRAGRGVEARLRGAGLDTAVVDAVAFGVGAALVTAFVVAFVLPTWLALAGGAGVLLVCLRYLAARRRRRTEVFVGQLPELARVLSNAASAGFAMASAINLAARELDEPAGTVLRQVRDELAVGRSIEGALENLRTRMPSREVAVLVATLVIQQRAGGDVVRALRDMSDTLERRKDLRREVRTILSGVLFTSWVVAGLGVVALLLLNGLSPGLLEEMTSSPLGVTALVVGGGLYAAGFALIRRVTRIET